MIASQEYSPSSSLWMLRNTRSRPRASALCSTWTLQKNRMNYGLCFPIVQRKCILIFTGRLRGDQVNCCAKYLTIRIPDFLLRSKLICIARELPFENSGLYFLVQKETLSAKRELVACYNHKKIDFLQKLFCS